MLLHPKHPPTPIWYWHMYSILGRHRFNVKRRCTVYKLTNNRNHFSESIKPFNCGPLFVFKIVDSIMVMVTFCIIVYAPPLKSFDNWLLVIYTLCIKKKSNRNKQTAFKQEQQTLHSLRTDRSCEDCLSAKRCDWIK